MLKNRTISLILDNDYLNLLSISIGKPYLFQRRFIEYIGKYNNWYYDVKEGYLKIDERYFNVEFIGTTSSQDDFWYSADMEKLIPDKFLNLLYSSKKNLEKYKFNELTSSKIVLNDKINAFDLSIIYIAFCNENVAYFCVGEDVKLYMFVKDLPNELYAKPTVSEILYTILEVISKINVNHKLLTYSLALEFDYNYVEKDNNIIISSNDNSKISLKFDKFNRITNYEISKVE